MDDDDNDNNHDYDEDDDDEWKSSAGYDQCKPSPLPLLRRSYHTWQFIIFTIFTITTFIFFHSFSLSFST